MDDTKLGCNGGGTWAESIAIDERKRNEWRKQRAKRIKRLKRAQEKFENEWDIGRMEEDKDEEKEERAEELKRLREQRRLEKKYWMKLEDLLNQRKEKFPWKIGPRILLSRNTAGKGESNDEWRERLGWFGDGNFKERYPLYESVGDPTEAVDEGKPPYVRYTWVWELGMWERKQWYVWDRKRRVGEFTRVTKLDGLYWSGSEAPTAVESRAAAKMHMQLAKAEKKGSKNVGIATRRSTRVQKPAVVLLEPRKGTRQSQRAKDKKAAELSTEVPELEKQQAKGNGKVGAEAKEKVTDDHAEPPTQDKPIVQSARGRGGDSQAKGRGSGRGSGQGGAAGTKAASTAQPASEKEPAKASKRGGTRGTKQASAGRGRKKPDGPVETTPQPTTQGGGARGAKQAVGGGSKKKADQAVELPARPVAEGNTDAGKKATGRPRKRKADEIDEPAAAGEPAPKKSRGRPRKGA